MPIRCATSRSRSGRAAARFAAAVAVALIAAAPARAETTAELSLPQARQLAVLALDNGDPGLAVRVAQGLLQADPHDAFAYYVIATANARMNCPDAARAAAARAYRFSEPGPDRYRSAQLAARMAYVGQRYSAAQFWLRRSAIHAPDARAEELVARDYRILRIKNAWAFRLRGELSPSSNVNKGADTSLQIIDGLPVIGTLNGAARALSGLIGSVDLWAAYRLRQDQTSVTHLSGRLFVQRVALSSSARAIAPMVSNSDYASTYAELNLRHGFAVGPAEAGGSASVDLSLGGNWFGGAHSFNFARLSGERAWRLGHGDVLELNAQVEQRFESRYPVNEARILGIGGAWSRSLQNGDRLSLQFAWRDTDAATANGTFRAGSVRASYALAAPVGPVRLSAGIILGYSDYPEYYVPFPVPDGRQDRSVYGDIGMLFSDWDYAGFAPMLRFRAGRKESNISRYTMKDFSVSLGIELTF